MWDQSCLSHGNCQEQPTDLYNEEQGVSHACAIVLEIHVHIQLLYCCILRVLIKVIAERLSARPLIVQCGLKSQLAYIYINIYMCATSVTLRNAIKSPVTFLICVITMSVRSVYALLLRL